MAGWMLLGFEILDAGFGCWFAAELGNQRGSVRRSVQFSAPEYRLLPPRVTILQIQRGTVLQGICKCCRKPRESGIEILLS